MQPKHPIFVVLIMVTAALPSFAAGPGQSLESQHSAGKASLTVLVKKTEDNPADKESWLALSNIYISKGEWDKAQECAEMAAVMDPACWTAYKLQAEAALQCGRFQEARTFIRLCIANLPADIWSYRAMTKLALTESQGPGEAEWLLRFAQTNALQNKQVFLEIANAFFEQGKKNSSQRWLTLSRKSFQHVLELEPNNKDAGAKMDELNKLQ